MDLHGQIMNMTESRRQHDLYANTVVAYLCGHRDARHAAAELALETVAAIDAMLERLRKDAISALADGGVLIRLPRVEGYEEVCDELLAADAMEGINWPSYEVLAADAKGTT